MMYLDGELEFKENKRAEMTDDWETHPDFRAGKPPGVEPFFKERHHPFQMVQVLKDKFKPEIVCRVVVFVLLLLVCLAMVGASLLIQTQATAIST